MCHEMLMKAHQNQQVTFTNQEPTRVPKRKLSGVSTDQKQDKHRRVSDQIIGSDQEEAPDMLSETEQSEYFFSDIDSLPSGSARSRRQYEQSNSTIEYEHHEPWEAWQHRVKRLCHRIFPGKSDKEITLDRMRGGSFNRVVGVNVTGDDGQVKRYVFRTPRNDRESHVANDVTELRFIKEMTSIPAPRVVTYRASRSQRVGFEAGWMVMERIPGVNLSSVYGDMDHETRCCVAREVGSIFRQLLETRSTVYGQLVFDQGKFMLTPLDPAKTLVDFHPIPWTRLERDVSQAVPYTTEGKTQNIVDLISARFENLKNALASSSNEKHRTSWLEEGTQGMNMLLQIAKDMQEAGWFDNMPMALYHQDLQVYNLMFDSQAAEEGKSLTALDFDGMMFAPAFMACDPPAWVWKTAEGEEGTKQFDQAQELKRIFDESAGEEFVKYAYHPVYVVARDLLQRSLRMHYFGVADTARVKAAWDKVKDMKPE
ncbi:hypothetical protein V8F20_004248 [Naviculisporaceae sp. PSN 640]